MRVSEIASQICERVPVSAICAEDYVSTDNMCPNFGGIKPSSSLPPSGNVTAYQVCDILLSNIRPYFRKTWLATHGGGCNADVLCIRADSEKCLPKYLYYLLTTDNFVTDYLKSCKGAKMPRGDVNRLLNYEFNLPDLPTQLRIAGVLGSIDEKIELNRRKIAELEALAKTIYDYWFVQFDFPDATGRPYKSSGGKMVWNGQLKREVPEGWEVVLLSNLCSISTKQCVPSKMDCNLLEHYSIPAFDEGVYPSFDPPAAILSNKFVVPQGGILYSKLNAQFKRIWDPLHLTALPIASSEFVIYVPHDLQLRGFIYATLNAERFYKFANSISSCSTGSRKRFTPETTYRFPVAIPNDNEIVERFSKLFSDILGSIKKCRVEGVMLRDTRDTLLPLLMNGQVVVG